MKQPLLCHDCEQRFHRQGENWLARQVYNNRNFPLLDRLRAEPPADASAAQFQVPDATPAGIDSQKLAYFALSVLWRAVFKWRMLDRRNTTAIDLGAYEEPIRQFLLGEAGFPSDVVVEVSLCTDEFSQGSCVPPSILPQKSPRTVHRYSLLARGIKFTIFVGRAIPAEQRQRCCFTSIRKPIFVINNENQFMEMVRTLRPENRV